MRVENRRRVVTRACYAVVAGTAFASAADAQTPATRPNIIFILADDLGIGDTGPYGQTFIQTPNINALADKGTTFLNTYCPAAVCTPTRASLMTGFHNGHVQPDRNGSVGGTGGDGTLRSFDVTVAEVLRGAGYSTGLVGKWGLGGAVGTADDPTLQPAHADSLPTAQGFQEVLAHLNQGHAHDYYADYLWQSDAAAPAGVSRIATNGANSHDLFAQRGEQFIAAHAKDTNPFYLQVSYTPPHQDIDGVPQQFKDIYAGRGLTDKQTKWAAMVSYLDARVGDIVRRVEDPNGDGNTTDSIAANTLIFFASDNGPHSEDGTDPEDFNSNGIYRGHKRDLYDGGVRTPLIARWDGHVAAGATNSSYLGSLTDFLPTAAELSGAGVPLGLDGASIAPLLTGAGTHRPAPFLLWESHEGNGGSTGARAPRWAVRDGNWKLIGFEDNTYELYNLAADPGETTNVVAANPSIKSRLESIATAEHVTRSDRYAVEYAHWTGAGTFWADGANWNTGGFPQDNWVASLANATASPRQSQVTGTTSVLAFEVSGAAAANRVDVDPSVTLTARNGVRVHAGGHVNLRQANLATARLLEVRVGGKLTGSGAVAAGTLINAGTVAVGQPETFTPPPAVTTAVGNAITFDFTGIQDQAPLTQTSTLSPHLVLSSGLDLGAGLSFRGGTTNAGNEFNVAGFGAGTTLTSAITGNDYLTFTVTPASGLTMKLDRVSFTLWRNGANAPSNYAILTSIDGFASGRELGTLNVPLTGPANVADFTASYAGATRVSGPLEVRLYGYTAGATTGNTHFTGASMWAGFESMPGETLGIAGLLTLTGDLEHLPGATLAFDILGNGAHAGVNFDKLVVTGSIEAAGAFSVDLPTGYVPHAGDSWDLLDFGSITGTFALDLPALPQGLHWDTSSLLTTGVLAVMVPEPSGLLAAGTVVAMAFVRRGRRIPKSPL